MGSFPTNDFASKSVCHLGISADQSFQLGDDFIKAGGGVIFR